MPLVSIKLLYVNVSKHLGAALWEELQLDLSV